MDGDTSCAGGCPVSSVFKRGIAIFFVVVAGLSLVAASQSSFGVSTSLDVSIGVGSLALVGGNLVWEKQSSFPVYSGVPAVALEDLNFLDGIAVFGYNGVVDKASTLATIGLLAVPCVYSLLKGDAMWGYGLMYFETVAMTYGLKELAKNLVVRERPYVYGSGAPAEEFSNGDYCRSFPSGHTALAFASATFLTMVMGFDDSASPWRLPVCIGSYAVALGVAASRVLSGNHYITDVLVGALVGAACGVAVPLLHLGDFDSSNSSKEASSTATFGIAPTGIAFGFSF